MIPHAAKALEKPRDAAPEVSVVIPCLNEAETLASCIGKAQASFQRHGLHGEIVVADNGSTDGSVELARRLGARVVPVEQRGYGAALMGGIEAARGRYIVMGDADDSYDFGETHRFVAKLRQGYDLVQGCRLPSGGGTVLPGAMKLLHRWWGNPMFTRMTRTMFKAPVHDVYCGLRGFTKEWYGRLGLRCTGMEFAIEMIVRSSLLGGRIAEIPITLYPDGRRTHGPHLKTFRDGWRTLRFLLLYSPKWLFFVPGLVLIVLGLLGYLWALPGWRVLGATLDAHTLLFASLAIFCGYASVLFGVCAKAFGVREGLLPEDPRLQRLLERLTLERGLVAAAAGVMAGSALLGAAILHWRLQNFGNLDYAYTMRLVIPGATLVILSVQTSLWSFFVSWLGMARPRVTARAAPAEEDHTPPLRKVA
jgi:glycosyltransferase involved in cell wall biosynthesis